MSELSASVIAVFYFIMTATALSETDIPAVFRSVVVIFFEKFRASARLYIKEQL